MALDTVIRRTVLASPGRTALNWTWRMTMIKVQTYSFDNLKRAGMQRLRVLLGIAQMAGVVCTITLLLRTGVSMVSLVSAMVTCLLTSVSVLMFGSHRDQRQGSSLDGRKQ